MTNIWAIIISCNFVPVYIAMFVNELLYAAGIYTLKYKFMLAIICVQNVLLLLTDCSLSGKNCERRNRKTGKPGQKP